MHMIDESTGRAAIAFVGETPWHGLGQEIPFGADLDKIAELAGLDYKVLRAPVKYAVPTFALVDGKPDVENVIHDMKERVVLYRSDTHKPLSVVSTAGYKVVQPSDVFDMVGKVCRLGGFQVETAGALSDGKRIWALLKAGGTENVIGSDAVAPYLLIATSYDGTLATIARFTAVRVVCHNTISIAVQGDAGAGIKGHASEVKIGHNTAFNPEAVMKELGLVHSAFADFMNDARALAEVGLSDQRARDIAAHLFLDVKAIPRDDFGQLKLDEVQKTKNFLRVMELHAGKAIGSDLTGGRSAWQFLNSVTQLVDHEMGRSRNTGLTSAWFGAGDALKTKAKDLLLSV